MLLTISTEHFPASDLGFLLHKHPDRFQSFDLSFGRAHVFYPEVSEQKCTACLLLDVDPVEMVRGRPRDQNFQLGQYVNDRPYVASSLFSVALSQVFRTALCGRCDRRPELAATPLPLTARIEVLPVRGGEGFLHRIFEPLGYQVEVIPHPLDDQFPEWGESPYFTVTLSGTKLLSELLTHLYVLIPVFDNGKHYYIGEDELEKLLNKGGSWLACHPEKEQIARRYLKNRPSLYRQALARLEDQETETEEENSTPVQQEETLERSLSLHERRHAAVLGQLLASGAHSVLDLGCGEGKLLRDLLKERQFERIVGMDVSIRTLEIAQKRLKLDQLPDRQAEKIKLIHGSLMYRDKQLAGFEAAAVVEVIEHLDPPRLASFERVLFEFARPETIVLTTPNYEYNVMWPALHVEQGTDAPRSPYLFRHSDHRFEWTRQEFQDWANRIAEKYGYEVHFLPIGEVDDAVGPPSQMGIFKKCERGA